MLRELSRSYLTIVKDLSRVMNRLKAVYAAGRSCAGEMLYAASSSVAGKIAKRGAASRERLYEQLDMLQHLRQQAARTVSGESQAYHHLEVATDSVSRPIEWRWRWL